MVPARGKFRLRSGCLARSAAHDVYVVSLIMTHDASVAVSRNGALELFIELERLFDLRYFQLLFQEWSDISSQLDLISTAVSVSLGWCDGFEADVGILEHFLNDDRKNWGSALPKIAASQWDSIRMTRRKVEQVLPAKVWGYGDHHRAHAMLGLYESGFGRALVLSYDGGGNDGCFNLYAVDALRQPRITQLRSLAINAGKAYALVAGNMPDIAPDGFGPQVAPRPRVAPPQGLKPTGSPHTGL